jgi:hypothetical protein
MLLCWIRLADHAPRRSGSGSALAALDDDHEEHHDHGHRREQRASWSSENWSVLISWNRFEIADGIRITMPAKMISEIPLPIPRSVICSPSHMMNAVPVVSVSAHRIRKPQPGFVTAPAPNWSVLEREREQAALEQREADRRIARELVDPPLALLASFLSSSSCGITIVSSWKMIDGADVGHDAQREDRQLLERAAREQREQAEDRALHLREEVAHDLGVDAGRDDVRADAVDREHPEREEDPLPELLDPSDVLDAGDHP